MTECRVKRVFNDTTLACEVGASQPSSRAKWDELFSIPFDVVIFEPEKSMFDDGIIAVNNTAANRTVANSTVIDSGSVATALSQLPRKALAVLPSAHQFEYVCEAGKYYCDPSCDVSCACVGERCGAK